MKPATRHLSDDSFEACIAFLVSRVIGVCRLDVIRHDEVSKRGNDGVDSDMRNLPDQLNHCLHVLVQSGFGGIK